MLLIFSVRGLQEVDHGLVAEVLPCGSIVGLGGVNFALEDAQVQLLALLVDDSTPFALPRDTDAPIYGLALAPSSPVRGVAGAFAAGGRRTCRGRSFSRRSKADEPSVS